MSEALPHGRRPVRDSQDHPVDAAIKAGPGTERTDPQNPRGWGLCPKRR
jgi:hypothetical protein